MRFNRPGTSLMSAFSRIAQLVAKRTTVTPMMHARTLVSSVRCMDADKSLATVLKGELDFELENDKPEELTIPSEWKVI